MDNYEQKNCRICLANDKNNNIIDSTCYINVFIQITGLNLENKLWLCVWCRATLIRTYELIKLVTQTEKVITSNEMLMPITDKSVYNLSYSPIKHINISPLELEDHTNIIITDVNKDNMNYELNFDIEEITQDPIYDLGTAQTNEKLHEITIKNKVIKSKSAKDVDCKRKFMNRNKKNWNYDELKFEVKHLNLEEQLNEVELRKGMNSKMKFSCEDCGLGFSTSESMEEHKVRHSEVTGPHVCPICKLRFKSSDVYSHHALSHRRRFNCKLCDATFKRWSYCIAHRYKCGGDSSPAVCVYCFKIFSNEHSLNIHVKGVHNKQKKYICEHCDTKFASKQRLTVHTRTHTGLKPYTCTVCSRSFTTSSNLRAHGAVHDDVTRHYCVECDTRYKSAKSLARHLRQSARHLDTTPFSCKKCTIKFTTKTSLEKHVAEKHNTSYRCLICDKKPGNKDGMTPLRVSPY